MSESSQNPVSILTLNPSVDISYEIDQLVTNKKMRSSCTQYYPGGNGINIARSLRELDIPIACYSIIGGESGNLLLRLLGDSLGDEHHYFTVNGETRLNAIMQQSNPPGQYEVDSIGPEIPDAIKDQIIDAFLKASHNNIAVLSGSIPPGVEETAYRSLTESINRQGGKVVVDASGKVLKTMLQANPYLLRLNRFVLESAVTRRLEEAEEVAEAAREIQAKSGNYVCITLGQQGAILVDEQNSYFCEAPRVRIKSTVGCGDAMMAGMISAIHHNKAPSEILRSGVICASATASHQGTELFEHSEVLKKFEDLDVIQLEI